MARKITNHKQPELMDQSARTIQTARRGHYACSDGKHQISIEDTDEASLKVASTSSSKKQCLNHDFPSDGMMPLKHIQTWEVMDLCDSSDDENSSSNEETPHMVMPLDHFLKMWGMVEEDIGCSTQEIEQSESVRKANAYISKEDSDIQEKAQYGRLMFKGTDAIFKKVMKLEKSHVFLDIGHGLGNMVLQAAYTVGCQSRGIEAVGDRHSKAEIYKGRMNEIHNLYNKERDGKKYHVGTVQMHHGSLEDPKLFTFLTKCIDVAFCNNFNETFGQKVNRSGQRYSLDDYIAGLFSQYQTGAIMVTLGPLHLGLCLSKGSQRHLRKMSETPVVFQAQTCTFLCFPLFHMRHER